MIKRVLNLKYLSVLNESVIKNNLNKINNVYFKNDFENLNNYKKKLIWRSRNLGMLELDIVVGKWASENIINFTEKQCIEYERDILTIETPNLYNYLLGEDKDSHILPEEHYLYKIKNSLSK